MAALTQSAVDGLLGLLKTVIHDEAKLIGGVRGDMKFIKDEMDSMNGFLLHLNKMEGEHDDQVRAWMKQVREVAYVAEDCVERYVRDMARHPVDREGCAGYAAMARLVLLDPWTYCELRKLGKQITELKARVLEVGERRQRYDVKVPEGRGVKNKVPAHAQEDIRRREAFLHKLEEELEKDVKVPVPFDESATATISAIILKKCPPLAVQDQPAASATIGGAAEAATATATATATICGILKKCSPPAEQEQEQDQDQPASSSTIGFGGAAEAEARAFRCTKKMFLCALYVYPYSTNKELEKLKEAVLGAPGVGAQEARKQVMVFCYSLLSTEQKKCLLYLTAFLHESEISRTSMVRRWVAEGCVGNKEPGGGATGRTTTPEEAGERCFRELLLRGFVCAARRSDTGTVKSCVMENPVRDFVVNITTSENFLDELPAHLERQLKIRSIVEPGGDSKPPPLPRNVLVRRCNLRCCGGTWLVDDHDTTKNDMDKLVDFIKTLPELYRLNVLDLGGCTGLKSRHLKSFCKVDCLKYLSLRKTDVSRLHANHINKLRLLETLDIRETNIPPRDTNKINLPKLKHLLASRSGSTTPLVARAVHMMPDKIGSMRDMETLSQVEVSTDGAELHGVAKLHQLRKLGVVVHANTNTAALLGRLVYMLAGNLRSLSLWVVDDTTTTSGILDISSSTMHEMASNLALENLDIKGKMSLPSWIWRAPKLANVTLRDTEMDGGDALRRLAAVQSLHCLKLSRKAFTEQTLRFKDVQFQALKFLVIEGDAFTRVTFFAGDAGASAFPKLEKIAWTIGGGQTLHNEELIVGIRHLPSLKEIELRASFKVNNLFDWASKQQTTPANPRYRIRYTDRNHQLITELPKDDTDDTLTLPAAVIN